MATVVELATLVGAPAQVVFDLARDMDVHSASLAHTDERATTSTGAPVLNLGDTVSFDARHFGVRWRMTARITEFDAPDRFVDEQVRGPFAALRHVHTFEPRTGGTLVTDHVMMTAPLGVLGLIAERTLLRRHLQALLVRRAQALRDLAENRSST